MIWVSSGSEPGSGLGSRSRSQSGSRSGSGCLHLLNSDAWPHTQRLGKTMRMGWYMHGLTLLLYRTHTHTHTCTHTHTYTHSHTHTYTHSHTLTHTLTHTHTQTHRRALRHSLACFIIVGANGDFPGGSEAI